MTAEERQEGRGQRQRRLKTRDVAISEMVRLGLIKQHSLEINQPLAALTHHAAEQWTRNLLDNRTQRCEITMMIVIIISRAATD